tara:strand:+ start:168 stop:395 length:228 start_codon:yes stop_codon:yes gene_type:complete
MSKETNSQFLLNSVRELDKINDIEFDLKGELEEIIKNPVKWAEEQAERAISENINKYLDAKKLGKDFWDGIESKS